MDRSHPLDTFFFVPIEGLRFLGFECIIGLFASLIISVASLVFLMLNPLSSSCDFIMTIWLYLITCMRIADIPIKTKVMYEIYSLSKRVNHEDRRLMTRRLMDLVRSRIFHSQSILNTCSFIIVVLGIIQLTFQGPCQDLQFYQFCTSVIMTFAVRLVVGAANFKYEERKVNNRGMGEFIQFFKNGATLYDIENIKLVEVNQEILNKLKDLCAICTDEFKEKEMVRVMPCNDSHNFHQDCIDRWLVHKDACPLCGLSIKTSRRK